MERRELLKFLGIGAVSTALLPPFISSCAGPTPSKKAIVDAVIKGIAPSLADDIILAPGLSYHTLLSYGDRISDADTFGFNNDYNAFIPTGKDEGILWTNHEYPNQLIFHFIGITQLLVKTRQWALFKTVVVE